MHIPSMAPAPFVTATIFACTYHKATHIVNYEIFSNVLSAPPRRMPNSTAIRLPTGVLMAEIRLSDDLA
jgi:hypothetical protein